MSLESDARLSRVSVLLSQRRWAMAGRELRSLLADEPEHAHAHAMLSLCRSGEAQSSSLSDPADRSQALIEATTEAQRAIAIDPEDATGSYALAVALYLRNRHDEAAAAIAEALRLDPADAGSHAQSAAIEIAKERFQSALDAAERGLAIDPENSSCLNLRSIALERLGRTEEAVRSAGETLRNDPDDAWAHASLGNTLLAQGKYREAQAAFREALRLDPDSQYARWGMVEAINSGNVVYRTVYRFQNWASRLGSRAGLVLLLGLWLLPQILNVIGQAVPMMQLLTTPLILLYIVFAVLTWIAGPLFVSFLRFHPFGKHLLDRSQIWASNLIAPCLGLSILMLVIGVAKPSYLFSGMVGAWYWVMVTVPIAATFRMQTRGRMAALGAASIAVILLPWIGLAEGWRETSFAPVQDRAVQFAYGSLGVQVISLFLATRSVKV